jgi:hypothetical protein
VAKSGRLGAATPCAKRRYVRARGTSKWRLTTRRRLAAGRYAVYLRAVDKAGNASRRRTLAVRGR